VENFSFASLVYFNERGADQLKQELNEPNFTCQDLKKIVMKLVPCPYVVFNHLQFKQFLSNANRIEENFGILFPQDLIGNVSIQQDPLSNVRFRIFMIFSHRNIFYD
jgi:hypothetical protein